MRSLILTLTLAFCLSGCWVGDTVAFKPDAHHPSIPKNPELLNKDLNKTIPPRSIVGEVGTVWRMDMTNPTDGEQRVHWLVLYPDGRCLTSLRQERWRGALDALVDKIPDKEGMRMRNAWLVEKRSASARRIEILNSRSPATLRAEYESKQGLFAAPKIGRFSASEEMISINLFELDPMQGAGLINYDTSAISRITFVKEGVCWKINPSETKTIWWAQYDLGGNLFNEDHAAVSSTRGIDVTIRKVDGYVPEKLPDDWQW